MLSAVSFPIRRRVLALCLLSAALVIGVSGCGSASSSISSSASAAAGSSGSSTGATYQARLNLAKCLRSHGVNVPDPSANGGAAGGGGGAASRSLRSSPNFQSAMTACAKYRSGAFGLRNISPAQRAQVQQQLVKFAQCMRSHGIDIPDPSTSGGGGFGIFRQIPSSERNSPAFQTAIKACSSTLPKFGRGGPGGGPGGGPPPGGAPSA